MVMQFIDDVQKYGFWLSDSEPHYIRLRRGLQEGFCETLEIGTTVEGFGILYKVTFGGRYTLPGYEDLFGRFHHDGNPKDVYQDIDGKAVPVSPNLILERVKSVYQSEAEHK